MSMTFYEACKRYREQRGIKLSDIADDTGYSVQNISAFEHGRVNNAIIYNYYMLHIVDKDNFGNFKDDVGGTYGNKESVESNAT